MIGYRFLPPAEEEVTAASFLYEALDPRNNTNEHEKFVSDISWIVFDFTCEFAGGEGGSR